MSIPSSPRDKQVFIDSNFVKWVYDANSKLWYDIGVVESIPAVSESASGLLTPQLKGMIDSIPDTPGGFGIIVDPKVAQTGDASGIITGDIKLVSDSINIECVGINKQKIVCENPPSLQCEYTSDDLPGIVLSVKQEFLDSIYINSHGPKGKKGDKGDKGPKGANGYSEGPVGIDGKTGSNVPSLCEFAGIEYNDIDGLSDTAIVSLKIGSDEYGCKLIATKSKLNIDNNRPADKVQTTSITRSIRFNNDNSSCGAVRMNNWTILKAPNDPTNTNIQLIRLPKGSNNSSDPMNFNGTMSLNAFVTNVINKYKSKLTEIDKQYGKEVKQYIESVDKNARSILSDLANQLSNCEFELPATEHCITFVNCNT